MTSGPRYSLRYAPTVIPTMEITLPETAPSKRGALVMRYRVVKRVRGISHKHAMIRANKWTRAHGDPR